MVANNFAYNSQLLSNLLVDSKDNLITRLVIRKQQHKLLGAILFFLITVELVI